MILAKVTGQSVHLQYDEVVSDSAKYLTASFEFDGSWDGYTKKAVFVSADGEQYSVILCDGNPLYLGDNTCFVPFEVIKEPCFSLWVVGVLGSSIITTEEAQIEVTSSNIPLDTHIAPTMNEYQQIIELVASTKALAQSVRNDADNGVFIGAKGDKGDKGEQGIQGEQGVQGVKGNKGDKGDKGDRGESGDDYILTEADKSEIANIVLANFINVSEVGR